MAGSVFIFMAWAVWIIATFILDKNDPFRLPSAVLALLMIILFPVVFSIYSLNISGPSLVLLFTAYILISKESISKKIYLFFSVMIIMFGYAGFYLLEIYDPVWVLMDRNILLSSALFIICLLLYPTSHVSRLAAVIIGTIHGEIFLSLFLSKWGMPYLIGSADYLDIVAYTVTALFISRLAANIVTAVKKGMEEKLKSRKQVVH